jgi:putative DNA primase/helicase
MIKQSNKCMECGKDTETRTQWQCKACYLALVSMLAKENHLSGDEVSQGGKLTDTGNGLKFALVHYRDVAYATDAGVWFVWNGKVWERDKSGIEMMHRAKFTAHLLARLASGMKDGTGEKGDEKDALKAAATKWAKQSESVERLNAMVTSARTTCRKVLYSDFDKNPWLFNAANMTIDLKTGEAHAHDRKDMLTQISPTVYDPAATCVKWKQFVLDVMGGSTPMRDYLQRAIGYTLTGDIGGHDMFLPWGPGGTGKTTFLRVIQGIMGGYCATPDAEMFMAKRGDSGQPFDLAGLAGKRALFASETEENKKLATSKIKRMTGGDRVSACFKGKDYFDFDPVWKIWLATNDFPKIPAGDGAAWQRVKPIPFNVSYRDTELEIKNYDKVMLAEEEPGILNWMLKGCAMWLTEGLAEPMEVQVAAGELRDAEDYVQRFIDERMPATTNTQEYAPQAETFKAFARWAEDNKEAKDVTANQFGENMRRKGYENKNTRIKGKVTKAWIGLALVSWMENWHPVIPDGEM